jgi:hypothetical protein
VDVSVSELSLKADPARSRNASAMLHHRAFPNSQDVLINNDYSI